MASWLALSVLLIAYYLSGTGSLNIINSDHINKTDVLHAISGSIGSALSITLLYPLETIRTRLQVDTTLTPQSSFMLVYSVGKKEGARGLYKGWLSLVFALMALNFVYFFCFHSLRRWGTSTSLEMDWMADWMRTKVVIDLIVGYLAGVVAVLVTGPLWLGEFVSGCQ